MQVSDFGRSKNAKAVCGSENTRRERSSPNVKDRMRQEDSRVIRHIATHSPHFSFCHFAIYPIILDVPGTRYVIPVSVLQVKRPISTTSKKRRVKAPFRLLLRLHGTTLYISMNQKFSVILRPGMVGSSY